MLTNGIFISMSTSRKAQVFSGSVGQKKVPKDI